MSKEVLTHSERYVRKTNRIILIIGITSFIVFLFGLLLLLSSGTQTTEYEEPVFTEDDDALNLGNNVNPLMDNIEFEDVDERVGVSIVVRALHNQPCRGFALSLAG